MTPESAAPEELRRATPSYGMRFSRADAVVLLCAAMLTWGLWATSGSLALLVPVTVGHFFLFCNVFRVRRMAELLWSGAFVVNVSAWVAAGEINWWGLLAVQMPVTIAVLVVEVRHPRYHGVLSRRPCAAAPGASTTREELPS